MQKTVLEIVAVIIVLITVIDFIIEAVWDENIVSAIRKMIRETDNPLNALKSQKRVTYLSILFKAMALCFLIFSAVFLQLTWVELILYITAISIFIVNITQLVNRAMS